MAYIVVNYDENNKVNKGVKIDLYKNEVNKDISLVNIGFDYSLTDS